MYDCQYIVMGDEPRGEGLLWSVIQNREMLPFIVTLRHVNQTTGPQMEASGVDLLAVQLFKVL